MSDKAERISLARCQYGVPTVENPNEVENCDEPAVALWTWPGGGGSLYVCQEHDEMVAEAEAKP